MSRINFMSLRKPKIPRTRRSVAISASDLHDSEPVSHHDATNHATSDIPVFDAPDEIGLCKLAPTLAFRNTGVPEEELDSWVTDSCTDGKATEHRNSELPKRTEDGQASLETDTYSNYEVFLTLFSILSYIFDVGSDIYLAYVYYSDGDIWWFTLTVIFIVVPSLTITTFSFVWYIQDKYRSYPLIWVPRLVLLFLQLGPLLRYIDTMIFGFRSKWRQKKHYWYKLKTYEETDSALLRLFECFMEAAPQLTLQLYIILSYGMKQNLVLGLSQIISCVTSLGSIAWALAAYQKALRLSLPSKAKLDCWSLVFLFIWRVLVIGPRVLAFAVFASCTQYSLFVLCGAHWLVMLVWIVMQHTKFCSTKIQEYCFNAVAAFICIFDFFNVIEGHTRIRYVIYYLIVYCENVAMVTVWYFYQSNASGWYLISVVVAIVALFWVGILIQVVYYLAFHPNNKPPYASEKRIRICVPCSELIEQGEVGDAV